MFIISYFSDFIPVLLLEYSTLILRNFPNYINLYYFTSHDFLTPALADGLLLECE